ncbi:MAG: hypothetical protein JRF62_04190 [Deltaproteobacteria bacterium]|nr:hypothetical protein [Deltaproteobacteria bacterium]MBW2597457.1 hypothetical protein [Deltaproteobacteria bacterium]MBW2638832.1 hypothetical protein [Deltaproteobacteria bacterium]MBW2679900.1 hypothetical protein [Deltaproteobacteria bacterium]
MKKIIKIIGGCDFSEYSKEALKYAAELPEDLFAIERLRIFLILLNYS